MDRARVDQECVEAYLHVAGPLRILLLRRPPSKARIWVPVSGKVESGDRSWVDAVRREVREETGFRDLTRILPLDWHVRFQGPDGRPWRLHAYAGELPFVATPRLSREHDAFEWVSASRARERLHYADNRQAVDRLLARVAGLRKP